MLDEHKTKTADGLAMWLAVMVVGAVVCGASLVSVLLYFTF